MIGDLRSSHSLLAKLKDSLSSLNVSPHDVSPLKATVFKSGRPIDLRHLRHRRLAVAAANEMAIRYDDHRHPSNILFSAILMYFFSCSMPITLLAPKSSPA